MALQAKANNWEQAFHHGFIPCLLAWMALNCVIWPSLRYPLAVTSFSMSQALSATSRLYHTLLPQLGANCFYPLALCHVPIKFHGLGLPHPFWEQPGNCGIETFPQIWEYPPPGAVSTANLTGIPATRDRDWVSDSSIGLHPMGSHCY